MSARAVAPLPERWAARWDQAREWMGLGLVFIPIGERLLERYSEPGRHYHDGRHVLSCLDAFDNYPGSVGDNDAVELALWFHDAVYDVHADAGANESDSAELFRVEFAPLARGRIDADAVCRLILATRHDGEPADADAALVMDIDLGILGAEPTRYEIYAEDIRRECPHVGDSAFCEGRARVLRSFLDRRSIYHTRHFRKLLEGRARANLEGELASLG